MRSDSRTYPKFNDSTPVLTSTSRTRLTGHPVNRLSETMAIDAEGNVTTQTVVVNRATKTSTATTTRSGIAGAMIETTVNGFSTTIKGFDGLVTTKAYDALLRTLSVTDSRNNTATSAYVPGTHFVQTVTTPGAVEGTTNQSTTTYDFFGRVITQRDPRNHYTRMDYNQRGQVIHQWGDGTMPVAYGYDPIYGDRTTMSTFRGGSGWATVAGDGGNTSNPWPAAPGTADITTWVYDGPSGLLTAKISPAADPASPDPALNSPKSVNQTYNLRGQTHTRVLARLKPDSTTERVTTTYGYDPATGELLTQTYNDSTPNVSYAYGRGGQVETVGDFTTQSPFTALRDLVYDPAKPWRLTAEAHSSFYGGRVMTRLYEETGSIGRVRGFQLGGAVGSNADLEQTFGFTTVGRFEALATKSNSNTTARTFRYTYRSDSPLIESLGIDQGAGPGGHPFTVTRGYETRRDLVTSLVTKWGSNPGNTRVGYAYAYDERGQRTSVVQEGDAFADYGASTFRLFSYNGRGELTGDVGYLGATVTDQSKPLPGRHHGFAYDHAGNRKWSDRTGANLDTEGRPALRDDYATNALNQYKTRENTTLPVSGSADPGPNTPTAPAPGETAVSVTGGTLTPVRAGRQGRYWHDEIAVPNTLQPWRGPLTIFTAKRGTAGSADVYRMDSRMVEVAAFLQTFTYDADGNLTSDGLVDYRYDAENRLIQMETTSLAWQTCGFPRRLLEFRYDYLGRRVQKRVVDLDQNPSVEISCRRYLYDGWNLIAEYAVNPQSVALTLQRTYTWGLDIVNSQTNAGGVGALLQITDHPTGKAYLPAYDGNGNIVALLNASSGELAACYEYSPYGEPLRAQTLDTTIADNPWRFSTKFTDLETGLVYYGHRFYDPKNGRFLNRDPIEESGGLNLYGFCGNNGVNRWDVLGHQYSTVLNDHGSYTATAMDPWGNIGTWNFDNQNDADRWGQAWVNHDMSIVGGRAVTDAYHQGLADSGVSIDDLKSVGYTLANIMDVDGINLALLPADVWSGWTIPETWRNTESGMFKLVNYLSNPREWLESYWSGYSWLNEMGATLDNQIATAFAWAEYGRLQMNALWARNANSAHGVVAGTSSLIVTGGNGNTQAYLRAKAAIIARYPGAARDFEDFEKSGVGLHLNSNRVNAFQSDHGAKYPLPVVFWDPSVAVQRADRSILSP